MQLDNQLITLIVIIFCVIICFRTNSTVLCTMIGSALVSLIYKNNSGNESIINFPMPFKKIKVKGSNQKTKVREQFQIDKDFIKLLDENEIENEIEMEMDIELNSNKIKKDVQESLFIPNVKIEPKPNTEPVIIPENVCLDGDERIAYNSIHRNEPTRVILGMGKAYKNLSKYVLEEVEEIESRDWWGNMDY